MGKQMIVAVAVALVVGTAFVLLGPRPAAVVRGEFPGYTAGEKAAGLHRVIGEVRFDNTPMAQAFAELARLGGTTIDVKWEDMGGLTRESPVTLHLHNIELSRAIEMVYGDIQGGETWRVEKGKIRVPPPGGEALVSRIYSVDDLTDDWIAFDPQYELWAETMGNRLVAMLSDCAGTQGGATQFEYWSGRVLAIQTRAGQRKIQEALALLRTHAPLAQRPAADPLAKMVPPVRFDNKPLHGALAELEKASGVDFVVAWRSLEAAGMNYDVSINLHTEQPEPLGRILGLVRRQVNAESPAAIACQADDGRVVMGDTQLLRRRVAVRIYDVRDLIEEMLRIGGRFPAPVVSPGIMSSMGGGGGGMSGVGFAGRSGFGSGGGSAGGVGLWANAASSSRSEAGDALAELIEMSRPQLWRVNGGEYFAWHFAGRLVVGASPEEHEQVEQHLAMLRAEMKSDASSKERP